MVTPLVSFICCSAWQQLVELGLELESLAAFCGVPWMTARFAWRQAEIPCKKHTAQSSYTSLWSLQQSCFVFSKANWLNMARCWLNLRFLSLVTLGHTAVFSGSWIYKTRHLNLASAVTLARAVAARTTKKKWRDKDSWQILKSRCVGKKKLFLWWCFRKKRNFSIL